MFSRVSPWLGRRLVTYGDMHGIPTTQGGVAMHFHVTTRRVVQHDSMDPTP